MIDRASGDKILDQTLMTAALLTTVTVTASSIALATGTPWLIGLLLGIFWGASPIHIPEAFGWVALAAYLVAVRVNLANRSLPNGLRKTLDKAARQ